MNTCHRFLLILLIAVTNIAFAIPFTPEHDDLILERLPEQLFLSTDSAKIKALRAQIKSTPNAWSAASQLAQHYIELAQTQADPRYMGYAQAVLKPWWQSDQPPIPVLIMRAVIRQNAHDFDNANADLDRVFNKQPRHVQAHLIKATIATVQGDYQTAIDHCRQLIRRSSMILALVCQSTPASLSGNALSSYQVLHRVLSATTSLPEKQQVWAWTSLAEIAWRLGNFKAADQHFQSALQTGIKDYYLLRVYADYLLQQRRPLDVIELLTAETQNDSLLLRLALASKMKDSIHLTEQISLLNERFDANRQRGSGLHKGDEARFMLHLMQRPQTALQLASQNWQVQRESTDTYILLQAAIAANDNTVIQQVNHWLVQQGTDDVLIQQILVTQTEPGNEI